MNRKILALQTALLLILFCSNLIMAQMKEMPLYPNGIPNSKPIKNTEKSEMSGGILIISNITIPTLTVYPAPKEKATGKAVLICPGGGYWIVAAGHEGADVAKEFNKMGITAFVLKYRIPNSEAQIDKSIAPLEDVQHALRTIRKDAIKYGINPNKLGVMGFSAGGHLAATASTHFLKSVGELADDTNVRPDFSILVYPVITFKDFGHKGSADQLIGKNPTEAMVGLYSNETQVTKDTPPAILIHAGDDDAVPVKNSLAYYEACQKNGVSAELHIYPKGGHGFGMNNKTTNDKWMDRVKNWLEKQ
jgi:acetyl esterase/lipase